MDAKRILFITQEISPYLPESELSLVGRSLPQGIQERGKEIRTFMPKFGSINERRNQLHEVIRLSGMNLIIDDTDHPLIIKVASIQAARMQVYFIDNEDFFCRKGSTCDEHGNDYEDNDERGIFYVRGVFETIKKLRWIPDIIHCHGWISAFAPLYIKRMYVDDPCFKDTKIIYSIYSEGFASKLRTRIVDKLIMDGAKEDDLDILKEDTSYVGLTRLAIKFADGVIQGSETVHPEISASLSNLTDKPFLPFHPQKTYINAINSFYDNFLDKK